MSKNNGPRFQKARFHVEFGPDVLFERVSFKMRDVRALHTHGRHFNARLSERNIPDSIMKKIELFSSSEWTLKTCEVRTDTGKFVNSTWEITHNDLRYWVTIGFGDTVETIVLKKSSGKNGIITSGELYDFVQKVNADLMAQENMQ